jgi:Skp family chaperone for outer membrane proteins
MKTKFRFVSAAVAAGMAFISVGASAQVAGIATFDTTGAIYKSKARVSAYSQVDSMYSAFYQQIAQKSKEGNDLVQQLYKQYDVNADKKLDDAEKAKMDAAKNPLKDQIQAKNDEIQQLQLPIIKARMFALEEIAKKFAAAQQEVITAKKISLILTPDAFLYAPDAANITPAITTALDRLIPTASITPDANWQPQQQTQQLYQAIGEILQIEDLRAAQAQQAQQQAAQPGQPAPAPAQPDDGR